MRNPIDVTLNLFSVAFVSLGVVVSLIQPTTAAAAAIPLPLTPVLTSPSNGAKNVPQANGIFSWKVSNSSAAKVNAYRIVISQNSSFSGFSDRNGSSTCNSTCYTTTTTGATSYKGNLSLAGQTYYWKVRANGSSGASGWSSVRSLTTASSSLSTKVDAFVAKWTGRKVDFDGAYGYQCVDLMRQYATDVLNLNSALPTGNAYSIYATTTSSKFLKIPNTPTGVPQKGDIIFWNKHSSNGNSGHVAIFISGNATSFTSFDQNFCTNSGSGIGSCAPMKVVHNYTSGGGVAGWLRPK